MNKKPLLSFFISGLLFISFACQWPVSPNQPQPDTSSPPVTPESEGDSEETPSSPLAFPGAMGYGSRTPGGRGGTLYIITNLNDSGVGSLREAVEAKGPRTIVFRVSGTIELASPLRIQNNSVTIAGQTSPGGITLKNHVVSISADEVIIRHIRIRTGDDRVLDHTDAPDALEVRGHNIIIDHVSTSWAIDETLSVVRAGDVTVQNSFITESLYESTHDKGIHGYGTLVRLEHGSRISFIQNLWAHHSGRSPRPGNYNSQSADPVGGVMDFRNNVIYNWGGSRAGYNHDSNGSLSFYNFVNNAYIPGPGSGNNSFIFQERSVNARGFFSGNTYNGNLPSDPYQYIDLSSFTSTVRGEYKNTSEFPTIHSRTLSANHAKTTVLTQSGAWPRDGIDARISNEVENKRGPNNRSGSGTLLWINTPEDAGGYITHPTTQAPPDSDQNGIPDDWQNQWETEYGLSATDPWVFRPGSEYPVLEEYLHWRHFQIIQVILEP